MMLMIEFCQTMIIICMDFYACKANFAAAGKRLPLPLFTGAAESQ